MRILLIAPRCFPVTGAEEIVNIKMLQSFNCIKDIKVDLISKKVKTGEYPSGGIELYDVPIDRLDVIEVDNRINIRTAWQHFICLFKFGYCAKGCHWAYMALKEAVGMIRNTQYDYVLTKSGPSELVGYYLKKHFGMKWVATWNDPYPISLNPEPYGKGYSANRTWNERRMVSIMEQADVHIFPSRRLCDYMMNYMRIDKERTRIIPHAVIKKNAVGHKTANGTLRLIHSGNLGYPRNARSFLEGLRLFLDSNPNALISFTILGNPSPQLDEDIRYLKLERYVEYKKPVEYTKSLSMLADYDVAVIIEANCKEGIFLPTKVSDFMQEEMPIFSISPNDGTLKDLYLNGAIPYFAPVTEPELICGQLALIWNDFQKNQIGSNAMPPEEFQPEYISEQYVQISC